MKKAFLVCAALLALGSTVRSQNVFTPATVDYTPEYWPTLVNTLVGKSNTFYLCAPSFTSEYALSLHGDTLVYVRADDEASVYYYVSSKNHKKKVKTKRYELVLGKEESLQIRQLIDVASETANFFDERFGIDGTIYYLFDYTRRVKVWSPMKGTRTGRAVAAMDSLCYAVEHTDREVLQRQLEVCHTLTGEFRELYPLVYFQPNMWSSSERVMIYSQRWLSVCQRCGKDPDSVKSSLSMLCDSVALWSRELFMHHNNWSVKVFLSDTSDARCEVKSSGREIFIIIPTNKLCRTLIMGTTGLDKGYYRLLPDDTWQPIRREDYQWWPEFFDMF